jgi:hypothetical protein
MSVRALVAREVRRPTALLSVAGQAVRISGVLREMDTDQWLSPLFSEVHAQAVEAELPEVVLDLRNLSYANASLWKCIVGWLKLLRHDARGAYSLRVRSDPRHRWQQLGLPALGVFGAERLILESSSTA